MQNCNLCPRNCNVDRHRNIGFCGTGDSLKIAKADLHFWEEPSISGTNGSGTVFFSGCSLGCVFCQNNVLSKDRFGKIISDERFYEILFELREKGAHNINLVTADHFLKRLVPILKKAKADGLGIPVVLNTSSYLKTEILDELSDVIDVYLADFKFYKNDVSHKYCKAENYADIAKCAIEKMYSLVGKNQFDRDLMIKGVIVRTLVLPDNVIDSKMIIKYLLDKYSDNIYISIMNQYTPVVLTKFKELNRRLTEREYNSVVNFAVSHGLKNGYIQQPGSDTEGYIPCFDLEGV